MSNKFSQFGIKQSIDSLTGDKIKIDRIINREILVTDFRIEDSNYSGKCLYLQFNLGDQQHVIFTGSKGLIETVQLIPKTDFPFTTTIVKDDRRFKFS